MADMNMHYIFIESERDPKSDPVVVWYNGGPGASSMFGLTVEMVGQANVRARTL